MLDNFLLQFIENLTSFYMKLDINDSFLEVIEARG
jgi:hypothetical protein